MSELPLSRWALGGESTHGYGPRFADLITRGEDVDGEARLADALSPRYARILDVGAGMGRVTAALRARGHEVTGIEPGRGLVAQAEDIYPGLGLLPLDILELSPSTLEAHGHATAYELVVAVGNVFILLAEDTERRALATCGGSSPLAGGSSSASTSPRGPRAVEPIRRRSSSAMPRRPD